MNRFRTTTTITTAIILMAGLFTCPHGFADFSGSVHDFRGEPWLMPSGPCVACHTPHFSLTDGPLWNHMTTAESFVLYTSATLDSTQGQPAGPSKLCLSCHDGITAVTAYGGHPLGENEYYVSRPLGTDLGDDHPISFTYDTSLAVLDGELHDPSTAPSGFGGTIQNDLLMNDYLECTSCHDVHNTVSAGNDFLLRKSTSALCLTCHNK